MLREIYFYLAGIVLAFFFIYFLFPLGGNLLVAIGLGTLVILITFLNPSFGLYILVISMLLSPEFGIAAVPDRSVDIRFDDLILFLIFFTYLFKMAINRELGVLKYSPLNPNILLLIAIMFISTLLGVISEGINFIKAFFYLLKMIEYYVLFFLTLNNIKSEEHIEHLLNMMFLVATIVVIYAMTQVLKGNRATAPFEIKPGGGAEPASFGGYLILMFGQYLGILFYSEGKIKKILVALLFIFSLVPFLYAQSRASYAGLVIFFLAVIIFTKKSRLIPVFSLLFVIILLLVVSPSMTGKNIGGQLYETYKMSPYEVVKKRIEETFITPKGMDQRIMGRKLGLDESSLSRVISWQKILFEKFPNKPFFGYGITGQGFIDSQYFLYLAEIGAIGLIAFFVLIFRIFNYSFTVYKKHEDSGTGKALSFGITCSLSGLLVHAITSNTFIIIRIMEPFWFLVACLMFIYTTKTSSTKLMDETSAK